MYCRKCGKEINYDAEMCVECQENEELFRVEGEETPQPPVFEYAMPVQQDKGSRMEGFGLALAGAIVSEFAIVFAYLLLVLMLASGGMGGVVMLPLSAGTSVFSLVAGIKSVKKSKECVNAGKVKPLPAFIMGIVSIVSAGFAFFFIFLALMLAGAVV